MGWYLLRGGCEVAARERRSRSGRIALLVVGCGISLLAAEKILRSHLRASQGFGTIEDLRNAGTGRATLKIRSSSPLVYVVQSSGNRRLVHEPKRSLYMADFGGYTVRLNREGMREDNDYPVQRRASTIRIAGIGDSGMWGWGVSQNGDYLAVMESNLQHRIDGGSCEVLNFAVPAYNTAQEVELFRERGVKYRPDIVIVGWCENDPELPSFLYEPRQFNERDQSYLFLRLFDRDRYRVLVAPKVTDRGMVNPGGLKGPGESELQGWDMVGQALAELKALGETCGFKILVFGPMKDPRIISLCQRLKLDYYNTLAEIPPDRYPKKEYGIHWMHPRKKGHRELAKYLEEALWRRGWLRNLPTQGVEPARNLAPVLSK